MPGMPGCASDEVVMKGCAMSKRSLRLSAKVGTILRAMVPAVLVFAMLGSFAPTAYAQEEMSPGKDDTYTSQDQFIADPPVVNNISTPSGAKLTLTKILTDTPGKPATGSVNDIDTAGTTPGVGIEFTLTRVIPRSGASFRTMKASDPGTFIRTSTVYNGKTDSKGMIRNASRDDSGDGFWKDSGNVYISEFPVAPSNDNSGYNGSYYYLLEEKTKPDGYYPAEPSIFDLPYMAVNKTSVRDSTTNRVSEKNVSGRVFHLHLFPKNVSSNDLTKKVTRVVDSYKKDRSGAYAQVGDTISWEVKYRIHNEPSVQKLGDGKLDLAEIRNYVASGEDKPFIVMADRLAPNLKMLPETSNIEFVIERNNGRIEKLTPPVTDYTRLGYRKGSRNDLSRYSYANPGLGENVRRNEVAGVAASRDPDGNESVMLDQLPDFAPSVKNDNDPQLNGNVWTNGLGKNEALEATTAIDANVSTVKSIWVSWTYDTTVTSCDDWQANKPGKIENKVAVETVDTKSTPSSIKATGAVSAPGIQFAKTKKPEDGKRLEPLPGAVFRIARKDDPTYFLHDDYRFYRENDNTYGAKPVEAVSDSKGIVTFSGIPIIDSTGKVVDSPNYALVEYSVPDGYEKPSTGFLEVNFDRYRALTSSALENQPDGVVADYSKLEFKIGSAKDYTVDERLLRSSDFKNANGEDIKKGMMNRIKQQYAGVLPLTGGKGIVCMLVAGMAIMIVGMSYRRYKENKEFDTAPAHSV